MRRSLSLVVVFALVAPAVAAPKKKPTPHTSGDEGYSVVLPGEPTTSSKKLATAAGNVTVRTTRVEFNGTVFSVVTTDYPDSFQDVTAEKLLDAVRDGMKSTDGSVVKESPHDAEAVRGREVRIEAGKSNAVRARVYFAKSRLTQVMVTGSKDGVSGAEADEFFKSFKWAN